MVLRPRKNGEGLGKGAVPFLVGQGRHTKRIAREELTDTDGPIGFVRIDLVNANSVVLYLYASGVESEGRRLR